MVEVTGNRHNLQIDISTRKPTVRLNVEKATRKRTRHVKPVARISTQKLSDVIQIRPSFPLDIITSANWKPYWYLRF